MIPLQTGECSRPFYDLIADGQLWDWIGCPYAIEGLGFVGIGMFIMAYGFVGLNNWSEGWTLPITWLAIVTPVMAAGFLLPGGLLRRIAGVLTLAVAMLIIGLYWWWGRS